MNASTSKSFESGNDVSVLIVSKPGEFRTSLATLIRSISRVKEIHFAEDTDSIGNIVCEHQPRIVIVDGDHIRSELEDTLRWLRSRARGGITVVMSEDHDTAGADHADAQFVKGMRPDRLLIEVQSLLTGQQSRPR